MTSRVLHQPDITAVEQDTCPPDARRLPDGRFSIKYVVPSMHCAGCIRKLESGLKDLANVDFARANLSTRQIEIFWHSDCDAVGEIENRISELGFDHHIAEAGAAADDDARKTGKTLLLCLAVAGFAAANIMLLSVSVWSGADAETEKLFGLISGLIAVPAVLFAGKPFFASAAKVLSVGRLNMDVPISVAVLLSLFMSLYEVLFGGGPVFFDAGVMLLFFLLIGRTLDHFLREKAASGVKNLTRLMARNATKVSEDGSLSSVSMEEIQPGMRLHLLPGDRFPVDAKVVQGVSAADRSVVTGEDEAVSISPGVVMEAGTLNMIRAIDVEAVSDAQTSFLAEVMEMMKAAETSKGRYRRIADRMASIYAPAVHLLALLTFLGWFVMTGEAKPSLVAAIAVLIITCPCALGLAVPVAHVVAANRLFKEGILMRDGSALERLAESTKVIFDKTGTLTTSHLQVIGEPQIEDADAAVLYSLARQSRHPAARAIAEHCSGSRAVILSDVSEVAGFGVEGVWVGRRVRLGRAGWVNEIGGSENNSDEGHTNFSIENGSTYAFQVSGGLRSGGADAVTKLWKLGLPTLVLSGDHNANVEKIAKEAGIVEYFYGLTPKQKIAHIEDFQGAGEKVLMVGDGLNDAPSLAAAHVSMAPADATDVSRASADFVFTRSSLMAVPFALRLSRAANKIVRQNFAIALAYNCIAVPIAIFGHVTPLIAAIAMSLSSVVVVANSMRLALFDRSMAEMKVDTKFSPGGRQLQAASGGI